MNLRTPLLTLCSLLSLTAVAQSSTDYVETVRALRPITVATTLRYGTGQVRNTYLTPLLYEGTSLGVGLQRVRRMGSLRWISWQQLDLSFTQGIDRGDHSDEWAGRLRYRYGALRATESGPRRGFTFAMGPYLGLDAGADYNLKMAGSNNPAAARAAANLGLSALTAYRITTGNATGTRFSLQLSGPVAGVALQPEYGSSYYETFYLANTRNDVHLTLPTTQQDLDAQFYADLPLAILPMWRRSDAVIRLGAAYHIETMSLNDVTTRHSTFEFVLGWLVKSLPVSRRNSTSYNTPFHEAY